MWVHNINDWIPSRDQGEGVMYSQSKNVYCKTYCCTFVDIHAVHLLPQKGSEKCTFVIATHMTLDDPRLANVRNELWAKYKYDVGLIKTAAPLTVTPRSDYRSCKTQYPLSPEAIEGITPVFESLMKQGVIVPCPDSPCRTPYYLPCSKSSTGKSPYNLVICPRF